MKTAEMKIIAHIESGYKDKFGIPRQSGMVTKTLSRIIFEKEYRNEAAFKGLEGFSHIWVVWQFSEALRENWSPTVRPPRLGGNKRMGVFATRSPFRPNSIGLSSVKLEKIEFTKENGPVLIISGADMLDGTPIFDVKPYLKFTDSHPDAISGYADEYKDYRLEVKIPQEIASKLEPEALEATIEMLSLDPRPSYQNDEERVYGVTFYGQEIKFTVSGKTLKVLDIANL